LGTSSREVVISSLRVTVASGKGGTGKTLVATNLAVVLGEGGRDVVYIDADVEEPNGHLHLHPEIAEERPLEVRRAVLPSGRCSGCGLCEAACVFSAVRVSASRDAVEIDERRCRGCAACLLVCGESALELRPRRLGTLRIGAAGPVRFYSAVLGVSEPRPAAGVRALLDAAFAAEAARGGGAADPGETVLLIDACPGTSLSALTAARRADLVLLVAEPTLFGRNDLALALGMCVALSHPAAAVLNRADLGDGGVRALLEARDAPLLAEIPFSREVALACARGEIAALTVPALRRALEAVGAALAPAAARGRAVRR
jgi:MinD superfamily P-loop ATPase